MRAKDILDDQVIVKKGRFNNFGFEPCSNSFFDFYVSPKYVDPAILKLEDISFHLFLRKNLNDNNPRWKMPTMRQMMRRLDTGQHRIESIMDRLDKAHLLKKESGFRRGRLGENIPNTYILSDPIATLNEFLMVAQAGLFSHPLRAEWQKDPCSQNSYSPVADSDTTPVAETATFEQTLNPKQTADTLEERLWENCLKQLQQQVTADTFMTFLSDTSYEGVIDGVAVITTSRSYAKDYLENRMGSLIKKVLGLELKMNGEEKISEVRFEIG